MNSYAFFLILSFLPFGELSLLSVMSESAEILSSIDVNGKISTAILKSAAGIGAVIGQASSFGVTIGRNPISLDIGIKFFGFFKEDEAEKNRRKQMEEHLKNLEDFDVKEKDLEEFNDYMEQHGEKVESLRDKSMKYMTSIHSAINRRSEQISSFTDSLEELKDATNGHFSEITNMIEEFKQSLTKIVDNSTLEINRAAEDLEASIKDQFRALTELNVHMKYTEAILLDIDALENLMNQAAKYPGNDTRQRFIEQYMMKRPRRIVLELANRFKYKFTNPIIASMEIHVFKSRNIFDHWRETIGQLLYRLLTIDGFYYGLEETPDRFNLTIQDPCFDAVKELMTEFNSFKTTFQIEPERYWPNDIGYLIDRTIEKRKIGDEKDIANTIQYMLNGIYTNDVFFIHVVGGNIKNEPGFIRSLKNPGRYRRIEGDHLYAVSPQNVHQEKKRVGGRISQITSYNAERDLAVSVIRSVTHRRRTSFEKFKLNHEFNLTSIDFKGSFSSNPGFGEFITKLNEVMGGDVGGAVMSRIEYNTKEENYVAERITNGARSSLYWHNQVPFGESFVNVMWI